MVPSYKTKKSYALLQPRVCKYCRQRFTIVPRYLSHLRNHRLWFVPHWYKRSKRNIRVVKSRIPNVTHKRTPQKESSEVTLNKSKSLNVSVVSETPSKVTLVSDVQNRDPQKTQKITTEIPNTLDRLATVPKLTPVSVVLNSNSQSLEWKCAQGKLPKKHSAASNKIAQIPKAKRNRLQENHLATSTDCDHTQASQYSVSPSTVNKQNSNMSNKICKIKPVSIIQSASPSRGRPEKQTMTSLIVGSDKILIPYKMTPVSVVLNPIRTYKGNQKSGKLQTKQNVLSSFHLSRGNEIQRKPSQTEMLDATSSESNKSQPASNEVKSLSGILESPLMSNGNLLPHKKSKKGTPAHYKYVCKYCAQRFRHKRQVIAHEWQHTEEKRPQQSPSEKRFPCKVCNKKFDCKSKAKYHERVHSDERPFQCRYCGKSFKQNFYRQKHENIHTGKYMCKHCEKRYPREDQLKEHLRIHGNEWHQLKCHICGKNFLRSSGLSDHLLIHAGKKPYICSICNKSFLRKYGLKKHENTHRGIRIHCDLCDAAFTSRYALKGHRLIHTGEKPYKCSFCDYASRQKNHITVHERIHTKEKPYKCQYCDYSASTSGSMVVHERVHTMEKPYSCKTCGKKFSTRAKTKCHEVIHSDERRYKCSFCDDAFKHLTTLRNHERIHSGERPFECQFCGMEFRQQGNCRSHEKRMHGL